MAPASFLLKKILLSAQPDQTQFLWQLEVLSVSARRAGIEPYLVMLIGVEPGREPSVRAKRLQRLSRGTVLFYPDNRTDKAYIPSIRPHIIKQYFAERGPHTVFYHDSDIAFLKEPDWSDLWEDDTHYLSDARSYTSAEYIRGKSENVFTGMCDIVGICPGLVQRYSTDSGGAQYLLKNTDYAFWHKVEIDSTKLFKYGTAFNDGHGNRAEQNLQIWAADMWAVLWNLWLRGQPVKIVDALKFCWPETRKEHLRSPENAPVAIYHDAGVDHPKGRHLDLFYKARYRDRDPYGESFGSLPPDSLSAWYCSLFATAKQQFNQPMVPHIIGLFYTNNQVDPKILTASLASIQKAADFARASGKCSVDIRVVSWQDIPASPFGRPIPAHFPGMNKHFNIAAQILQGLEGAVGDVVSFLEHDCLYPHDYFVRVVTHLKPHAEVFFNEDYLGMARDGYVRVRQRDVALSQLSMRLPFALQHFREKLIESAVKGWCYLDAVDKAKMSSVAYYGHNPAVHVNHTHHFTNHFEVCYERVAFAQEHPYWKDYRQYYPIPEEVKVVDSATELAAAIVEQAGNKKERNLDEQVDAINEAHASQVSLGKGKKKSKFQERLAEAMRESTEDRVNLPVAGKKELKIFKHSGNIGDVIYSLPTMKALGGGLLYLVANNPNVDAQFTVEKARSLKPLLEVQSYITGVVVVDYNSIHSSQETADLGIPSGVELDLFRKVLKKDGIETNLAVAHLRAHGLDESLGNEPWLTVPDPLVPDFPVLMNWTPRFPNPKVDFTPVFNQYYGKIAFIGHKEEAVSFLESIGMRGTEGKAGKTIEVYNTPNLLEAARWMAGCKLFIGWQSAPYAIAEGLKLRTVQVTCPGLANCVFEREDALYLKEAFDFFKLPKLEELLPIPF